MSVVVKSVLVAYSARQMFHLVDAIEDYPQFLPWCDGTRILQRDDIATRATIHINYRGIRQSFTTGNTKEAPVKIAMKLVEGPFSVLDGEWRFTALAEDACRIDLRLHYEFSSRLLETLVGPVFGYIADTLVDAFVGRAEKRHGG